MNFFLQKLLDNFELWLKVLISSIEGGFQSKKTLHLPAGPTKPLAASEAAHCRIVMAEGQRSNGQPTLRQWPKANLLLNIFFSNLPFWVLSWVTFTFFFIFLLFFSVLFEWIHFFQYFFWDFWSLRTYLSMPAACLQHAHCTYCTGCLKFILCCIGNIGSIAIITEEKKEIKKTLKLALLGSKTCVWSFPSPLTECLLTGRLAISSPVLN